MEQNELKESIRFILDMAYEARNFRTLKACEWKAMKIVEDFVENGCSDCPDFEDVFKHEARIEADVRRWLDGSKDDL